MKLRPLHDRVIVKRLENETKTALGIIIPDNAAEKPDQVKCWPLVLASATTRAIRRPERRRGRPRPVRQVLWPDRQG